MNTASVDRELVFLKTGCKCYGALVDGRLLETGERTPFTAGQQQVIVLRVTPPAIQTEAEFHADFVWQGDGPQQPETVSVTLPVLADVSLAPQSLARSLLPTELAQPLEETIHLTRMARDEVLVREVPEVLSSEPFVEVKQLAAEGHPTEVEPGLWRQEWDVHLSIQPPANLRPDAYPVQIRCQYPGADGERPNAAMQIILRLKTPLQYPESLYFGRIPVGQQRSRKLLIRSTDESPFALSVDEQLPAGISVKLQPEKQREHWVEITTEPNAPGDFEEVVLLRTSHPRMPEVRLHVTGIVFESSATDDASPSAAE
ncbi:MAG: hypothetical protein KDA58_05665 [Planctomycetaceae bacterium]|nr:hypothetical protein [Planctomycetaceae bacterium]